MDPNLPEQLEGQTSINELLDEPVGVTPVQLALPIHFQLAVAVRQEP
ncbi:MAG: hypothetical protein ABWX69_05470 [Arthrobacter sp.]